MIEASRFRLHAPPALRRQALVVGWRQDAGGLGQRVIDFLNGQLKGSCLGEVEPLGFFSFGGVRIEDDVIQAPEARLFGRADGDVLLFESTAPEYDHYKFLGAILDLAQQYCTLTEVITVGGVIALVAHTAPRGMSSVVNRPQMKEGLVGYEVQTDMSYQTPPGGRPTLSSLLSWVAQRRSVAGLNLWTEVPFYLAGSEDVWAARRTLRFLDRRFNLKLDFGELDLEVDRRHQRISRLREQDADVAKWLGMIERGIMLSAEENEALAGKVTGFLKSAA